MENLEALYSKRTILLEEIEHLEGANIIHEYNRGCCAGNNWMKNGLPISGTIGAVLGACAYGLTNIVQYAILNSTFSEAMYEFMTANSGIISFSAAAVTFAATSSFMASRFKANYQCETNFLEERIKKNEAEIQNKHKGIEEINKKIKSLEPNRSTNALPINTRRKIYRAIENKLIRTENEISKTKRIIEECEENITDRSLFTDVLNLFPKALFPFMGIPITSTIGVGVWAIELGRGKRNEIILAKQEYANQVAEVAQSQYGVTLTPEISGPYNIIQQMVDIKASLSGADLNSWAVYTNQVSAKLASIQTEILGFDQVGLTCGVLIGSMAAVTAGIGGAALIARKKRIKTAIKNYDLFQQQLEDLEIQKKTLQDDLNAIKNGGVLLNEY